MARGFPPRIESSPRLGARAEKRVHDALIRLLDSDWYVYHSVRWSGQAADRKNTQGEVDFVVSHPRHGIFLLEVKSGHVFTIGRSWYRKTPRGDEQIRNPFQQLENSAYALNRKYQALNPGVKSVSFGWVAVFPDDEGIPRHVGPDGPPDLVMTGSCLDRLENRFSELSEYWSSRPSFATGEMFRAQIDRIIRPEATMGRLSSELYAAANEANRTIERFTERQRGTAQSLVKNRRMSVLGGAGTGKTVLAVQRSIDLAKCGYRTLLLTYSEPLARHLDFTCQGQPGLTVSTFHAWLHSLVRDDRARTDAVGSLHSNDGRSTRAELPMNLALDALSASPALRWDAVIIDEAQDFDDEWMSLIGMALAAPCSDGEGPFFLQFYDPCQSLRRRAPAEMPGEKEQILFANHRSTEQIAALVSHYHGEIVLQPHGPSGPDPVYHMVGTETVDEVQAVSECLDQLLKGDGFRAEDVGVICLTESRGRLIRERLVSDGVLCSEFSEQTQGGVVVDTAENFKGLDRGAVVVCELGAMLLPPNRDALYVAITRARAFLAFVGTKPHCEFVKAMKWRRGVASPFKRLA